MKVISLLGDEGGCGFYRIKEPARVTRKLGIDVCYSFEIDVIADKNIETNMVEVLEVREETDLIIIQRPVNNSMYALVEQAKRQGIATIVEIDDDFDTIHAQNTISPYTHLVDWEGSEWVRKTAAIADHVIVSTPRLLKYAPHKRATVLRNYVPESIFDIGPANLDNPVLGWTGTTQTHPTDLQATKGQIGKLTAEWDIPFKVVGDGKDVQNFLKLDEDTPFSATGWVSLQDYYQSIVNTFNIGIVPLELSPFNEAKSALKGLEFGALGIPFVASPTREYELLSMSGVGKIATGPTQWYKHINNWLLNHDKLVKDAEDYRDVLYNGYTYEQHASDWATVWEQAITYRKKNSHDDSSRSN